MIGFFIGDMAGSFREFVDHKFTNLPLLPDLSQYPRLEGRMGLTDDSILAMATALACHEAQGRGVDPTPLDFARVYHRIGNRFPTTVGGYGRRFLSWLDGDSLEPYGSCGNGSAMRIGPVVAFARSLEHCDLLATNSALATHNHTEGVKGARMVALMAWLYAHGEPNPEARIQQDFGIVYGRSSGYDHFDAVCQETLPLALDCLDKATGFEDALWRAVTVPNGDSDTLGAIVGTIAEARWGVPAALQQRMASQVQPLLREMFDVVVAMLGDKQ